MNSKNSTNSKNPTNSTNPTNQIHVPLLDLTRQYDALKGDIHTAIQRVLASGRFILGPEVKAFEQEVASYCDVKHAIGVASGTDALLLSLKALGVGTGDKVVVPSFTFFATAGVVYNVGATPVFADIDPRTFNIDPAAVRRILTTNYELRTNIKAIIPVHLYGQPADMAELMKIAEEYGLYVVEDAAQAIGAEYRSGLHSSPLNEPNKLYEPNKLNEPNKLASKAGTIGDLGCLSFFPTKNLGAYGDGGMVITNDEEFAERVRILRVHGSKPKYHHRMVGVNSRLDALQAAILRVKLPHLQGWSDARQRVADRYDELLGNVQGIKTPHRAPDRTHIFHQYTIRAKSGNRDALREYLKEQGVGTMIYYPLPLHLQECFHELGYKEGDLPESEQASKEVLSLPVFPELKEEEQDYVAEAVRDFLGSKGVEVHGSRGAEA